MKDQGQKRVKTCVTEKRKEENSIYKRGRYTLLGVLADLLFIEKYGRYFAPKN